MHGSLLASTTKGSVAIPSRSNDKNRTSTSQPGGMDILLKIQKEGLFNFKQPSDPEESKAVSPVVLKSSIKGNLRLSPSPKRGGEHEDAWNRLHGFNKS